MVTGGGNGCPLNGFFLICFFDNHFLWLWDYKLPYNENN